MEKRINYVRPFLVALSALTVTESGVVVFRSASLLRAWHGDALFDASMVVLLLGVMLGIGGACLAFRGIKDGERVQYGAGNEPPPSFPGRC